MKNIIIILSTCITLCLVSCSDDNSSMNTCGTAMILDVDYNTTISDEFNIISATITGNCLSTTIQYGGGCSDDISYKLLGSTEDFPVTLPAMLRMKIVLELNL